MNDKKLIVIGKFGAPYGIRGWIKIFSFTEDSDRIFDYKPLFIKKGEQWQEVDIESFKHHQQDKIAKLKNIDDRDHAQLFTNFEIYTDESLLPSLGNDDYYWKDLMGCAVINESGYDFGQVTDLMETGSNDVLVVKANLKDAFGQKERLIPFIQNDFIISVDIKNKIIKVDWDPAF